MEKLAFPLPRSTEWPIALPAPAPSQGAGSDGGPTRLYSSYGFSKAGMAQLAKSLSAELKETNVRVHTLSPGMVMVRQGRTAIAAPGGRAGRGPALIVSGLTPCVPLSAQTELLSAGRDKFGSQGRFFVNALAEEAPFVAASLVPRLRQVALGGPSSPPSTAIKARALLRPRARPLSWAASSVT